MTDPVEAFRQRTKDRLASEINDPFSDRSGYGDPDLFAALLDEYDRSPARSGTPQIELETRVALHVAAKSAQVQKRIAESAERTARRLVCATWVLVFSSAVLAGATVVLCVVTANH